jgi:hypothetical protein
MRVSLRESVVLEDEWSHQEIVFYYFPPWRKYVAFLRDRSTKVFIARVLRIAVCAIARFRYCKRKRITDNLVVETKCCVTVEHEAWDSFVTDKQFLTFIQGVKDEAKECAMSCARGLYHVEPEVDGVVVYVVEHPLNTPRAKERFEELKTGYEPEEYCLQRRCDEEGKEYMEKDVTDRWSPYRDMYERWIR